MVPRLGSPLDGLERGGHRAARRVRQQQRAVSPPRPGDGLHRACAVRRRRRSCRDSIPSVDVDAAAPRRLPAGAVPRRRPAVRRSVCSRPRRARSSSSATRWSRMGQPHCPRSSLRARGPRRPVLAARFPLQLLTPKHHNRFLNSGYSHLPRHGRPRPDRSSSSCRRRCRSRLSSTATAPCVCNDRATVEVAGPHHERLRPGVVAIPFGWWRRHHPDGMVANSLTNDTLTEWGGGVAFSDTLVGRSCAKGLTIPRSLPSASGSITQG